MKRPTFKIFLRFIRKYYFYLVCITAFQVIRGLISCLRGGNWVKLGPSQGQNIIIRLLERR